MLQSSSTLYASVYRFFISIYKDSLRQRKPVFVIMLYMWILIRAVWASYYFTVLGLLYLSTTIAVGVAYYVIIIYIPILSITKRDCLLFTVITLFSGFLLLEIFSLPPGNFVIVTILRKLFVTSPLALLGSPSTPILGDFLPNWNSQTILLFALNLTTFTFICAYAFIYYHNKIVLKLYLFIFLTVLAILYGLVTTDQMRSKNELLLQRVAKAINEYKIQYGEYPSNVWQLILSYKILPITYHLQPISYYPESQCLDYGNKFGVVYFLFLPGNTVESVMGRSPCISSKHP